MRLIPYNKTHCRMLYEWRTVPLARAFSLNDSLFTYEEHKNWFEKILSSPRIMGFVLMDGVTPAAHIRFDKLENSDRYLISFASNPDLLRRGYASKLMEMAFLRPELPADAVFEAEVLPENEASLKTLLKSGFINDGRIFVNGKEILRFIKKK
ncbi:MAG: GNAT family N-acetyltransferase [Candidatus Riflebacteria bacterium]|nr:GNAT family N-acetyltransferase [Candidatus Riflebacteria bacterium]